jgi:hypothetical protein
MEELSQNYTSDEEDMVSENQSSSGCKRSVESLSQEDADDDFESFQSPIFSPPKKRRGFTWTEVLTTEKEEIKKGHVFHGSLRDGKVKKCAVHVDCQHYIKILNNGQWFERGKHSQTIVSSTRGISPLIIDSIDEKLRGGLMPTFIHNLFVNDVKFSSLAPTAAQISNRKRFLNRNHLDVDTVKGLQNYILSREVTFSYIFLLCLHHYYYYYYYECIICN